MATLLFECFSEEMPARMQKGAREQLQQLLTKALTGGGIAHGAISTYASPRHLAIRVEGLPAIQPDVTTEKKGPKLGAPQAAIDGFLKSAGLTSLDQCEQRVVGKDTVYFALATVKGRPMAEWLKDTLEQVMRDYTWPKSMRWGAHSIQWVRPLHRIVALLDSTVIPVQFGHLTASNVTAGHRFLAPAPITLAHADEYVNALETAHVMVDADKRRDTVAKAAHAAANAAGLTLVEDAGLLDEVTGLVEWPFCHVGTFDEHFMSLPREVLTSEMRHHQKYFALQKPSGELSNHFIITANMDVADAAAIKHGNARVLRARLADGEFYWNQDRAVPLNTWAEKLKDVVFHAKVGMMNEKVERIIALSEKIATALTTRDTSPTDIKRAAALAKADLTTGMVGEFPELQGIMGRYYALQQGEKPEVADAIRDHYKPVGANDDVPTHPIAICVALADKIDSITSLFAAGEKPTGSKDPLALRRAALGVLRIILRNDLNLTLDDLTQDADVLSFFRDRLAVILRDEGIRHDVIAAVLSGPLNATRIRTRALAVQSLVTSETGAPILAAYKRASNILSAEEKKDKARYSSDTLEEKLLKEPQEQALHTALLNARQAIRDHLETERFSEALAELGILGAPLTAFFDAILVNAEDKDVRVNRLSLLAFIRETMHLIADFSVVEG